MARIDYIERTCDYYMRKGFGDAYRYAHHDDGPFTRLHKPLAESRLVLVSSAGIEIVPDDGPPPEAFKGPNTSSAKVAEVFQVPSDIPAAKLKYITGAHNRADVGYEFDDFPNRLPDEHAQTDSGCQFQKPFAG